MAGAGLGNASVPPAGGIPVAQAGNQLYRRLIVGRIRICEGAADYQSAIRQTVSLRHFGIPPLHLASHQRFGQHFRHVLGADRRQVLNLMAAAGP
jgi:hypothetical protein